MKPGKIIAIQCRFLVFDVLIRKLTKIKYKLDLNILVVAQGERGQVRVLHD